MRSVHRLGGTVSQPKTTHVTKRTSPWTLFHAYFSIHLLTHPTHSETNPLLFQAAPSFNAHLSTSTDTKALALSIIGTTVRSQSFTALYALFTHPLNLTCFALVLFLVERLIRAANRIELRKGDPPVQILGTRQLWLAILSTWGSIAIMLAATALIALRLPYRELASEVDDSWLSQDEVIVATPPNNVQDLSASASEDKIIGALVFSYYVREVPGYSKCRRRRIGRGFIRAWSVERGYRKQGVGTALLREAARVVAARGGEGIWFSDDHAHSTTVLPDFYNQAFEHRNRSAFWKLEDIWEAQKASPRKRG